MTRVKRSVHARKKRRATLERAKGFRGDANSSHILEKKSPKRKRKMGLDRTISKADRKAVTKLLGGNGR